MENSTFVLQLVLLTSSCTLLGCAGHTSLETTSWAFECCGVTPCITSLIPWLLPSRYFGYFQFAIVTSNDSVDLLVAKLGHF